MTHHIAYTLQFEQALQLVNPSVAIPYWEYTIEGARKGCDIHDRVGVSGICSLRVRQGTREDFLHVVRFWYSNCLCIRLCHVAQPVLCPSILLCTVVVFSFLFFLLAPFLLLVVLISFLTTLF